MTAKKILIIDSVATAAYDGMTLKTQGLGGTEASVIRVAEALAAVYKVFVAQTAREQIGLYKGVVYLPFDYKNIGSAPDADVIINVRALKILPKLRRLFSKADIYLWMHCNPGKRLKRMADICVQTRTTIVAVSNYHRRVLAEYCRRYQCGSRLPPIVRIYNPVVVHNTPHIKRQPYKLVNFSSPHKGLGEVLRYFQYCRQQRPELQLFIANPGYLAWDIDGDKDGITHLGSLPQRELHRHVQESGCLFYPQTSFAETFGLVYAEAQALGTPVLCSDIGSAREIVGREGGRVLSETNERSVFAVLESWLDVAMPSAKENPDFSTAQVCLAWRSLIESRYEDFVNTKQLSK